MQERQSIKKAQSAIGFTLEFGRTREAISKALPAQKRALSYFPDIKSLSIRVGETGLDLWGRVDLSDCVHTLPDGSLLALIGSPVGDFSWLDIAEMLDKAEHTSDFELPWDGRVILIRITPDGKQWTMWNDWLGSVPVFHTEKEDWRIASTLEPVVVSAAGFTSRDFFLPGLLSLLIHGNYLNDWTLFNQMKVVPPDCRAEWDDRGFRYRQYFTVTATDARWETGWDELMEEMYTLSRQAIQETLATQPLWLLPLSSGLDSRLIAVVGAELGIQMHTYTFGSPDTADVSYARQIANRLGLPWKRIDLGNDYLAKYSPQWADIFGSAMHFHGMHQIPFFEALKNEPPGPIISGFIGDCLAGYDVRFQTLLHSSNGRIYQIHPDGYVHWSVGELGSLLIPPTDEALEALAEEIQRLINIVPGPFFQRLRFLTLWGRQRFFTYYQSMMCDYWRGVATPFINRSYARFAMSLPRAALDDRRLMGDMFKRYYSKVAAIPGSYGREPYYFTLGYVMKRRMLELLPENSLRKHFTLINTKKFLSGVDCVQHSGKDSFWPIFDVLESLSQWINVQELDAVYQQAYEGDLKAVRKLQSLQAIAYRLRD